MKSFNLLTEKIETWLGNIPLKNQINLSNKNHSININNNHNQRQTGIKKIKSPVVITFAIVSLTTIVGYRYINQPKLDVGTTAPQKIFAPSDGSFEDIKTTEEKRRLIRTGVIPTLTRDETITQNIYQELQNFLSYVDSVRQLTGKFPLVDINIISLNSQIELRQLNNTLWTTILNDLNNSQLNYQQLTEKYDRKIINLIQEIRTYRQQLSDFEYNNFLGEILISQAGYEQVNQKILTEINPEKQKDILNFLNIPDQEWEVTKNGILQVSKEILTQGIPPGIPNNLIAETISVNVENTIPKTTSPIVINLLKNTINKPNLVEDKEETKRNAEQVAEAIPPVIININKGELIVDEGQVITQRDFVLLDGFGLSKRSINWHGLAFSGLIVITTVGIFAITVFKNHRTLRCRDHLLLYLLSLSVPVLAVFHVPYSSLPAVALLVSSFYSPKLAIAQTLLLTTITGFSIAQIPWPHLLGSATGGVVAAIFAGRLHSREELAMLGGAIALSQGGVYLIINLIVSAAAGTIWNIILPEALFYGVSGLAWVVVALGLSPYLEKLFDLITPIRLSELSNPNRPLLKRLALEAPGTFQHTLFVASLAEAAARELNCNVELVRAGTLYHDIGKMHDPQGFIENQMGGPNKHDEIDDPWKSAEIIKKHVSEGLSMAKKYNLPRAIRDFIPEHQGKLLIAYFYVEAKKRLEKEGKEVQEGDFRYDGPIPQSRETAVVMLADACEAALRSLKQVTPEQALIMVQKILKARWDDRQLTDSGIRKEELPIIAEIFVKVWQQHNHQRIVYPKLNNN